MKLRVTRTVDLFVSYSHENAAWFKKLKPLLKFNAPTNVVHVWHDQELKAGDQWDTTIRAALDEMDVFICLLSYEFLASDYIMNVEIRRALERQKQKQIEIIPILLYEMNLQVELPELHAFNPLPAWGKCWRDYEREGGHYQDAHKPIREGLLQAIDKAKAKRKSATP